MLTEIEMLYRRALTEYGDENQVLMLFEEMAELQDAICKFYRGRRHKGAVIEEIADVMIMCGQMRMLFGRKEVDKAVEWKLERLKKRLEE